MLVVGVTEHDLLWGVGVGLATLAALVAARALNERRSSPVVWPPDPVSLVAAITVAGVMTPIWLVDFVVMGIVRRDAGTYTPGGLMLVYAVGALVAVLWVASLLTVLWSWTADHPVTTPRWLLDLRVGHGYLGRTSRDEGPFRK
jgi:hypothetical protein